jgi:hypothetical protein
VPTGAVNGTLIGTQKKSLSGGAIAGIVIGVLLGVALLMLLCFCYCLKAGIDGVLAFFGLGGRPRRRRSRETVIEEEVDIERRRRDGRSWVGSGSAESYRSYDRYSRGGRRPPSPRRTGGGGGGLGGIGTALAAGLGTAGLMRMFGRGTTERRTTEKVSHSGSGSYGSYSGTCYDYR